MDVKVVGGVGSAIPLPMGRVMCVESYYVKYVA